MTQQLPLNGFYESTTLKNSARRCVNLIPINEPNGSLSTNMLECPSGIAGPVTQSETASDFFGFRAPQDISSQVFSFNGNAADVAAVFCNVDKLVRVKYSTGGALSWDYIVIPDFSATIPYMQGARFAASESRMVAVSGSEGAEFSSSVRGCAVEFDAFYTPTVIDLNSIFGAPHSIYDVAFLGGRFIYMYGFQGAAQTACYYSDIGSTTPDITQFFAPDIDYGRLTGLHVLNGSLRLFDERRCYLFSLTSSTTTPFQWQRNATINVGLVGPHCKAEASGGLYFLGIDSNGKVQPYFMSSGVQAIGTPAVIDAINESGKYKIDFSTGQKVFTYTDKGRDYVAFKTLQMVGGFFATRTFVYSIADGRWFEMSAGGAGWDVTGYARHRDAEVLIGTDFSIDGSSVTLQTGVFDSDIGTEFGESMERYVVSAPFNANNQTIRLSEVEPIIDSVDSQSADVTISLSTDYGATFGTERTITKTVNNARSRFMNWGAIRQAAVFKIKVASNYPVKIVKLLARMKAGTR